MALTNNDAFLLERSGENYYVVFSDLSRNVLRYLEDQGLIGGGGGSSVSIGDTPPLNPTVGDLWFNSLNGRLYIYYKDPDPSTFFWVDVSGFGLGAAPRSSGPYPFTTEGISYPLT